MKQLYRNKLSDKLVTLKNQAWLEIGEGDNCCRIAIANFPGSPPDITIWTSKTSKVEVEVLVIGSPTGEKREGKV